MSVDPRWRRIQTLLEELENVSPEAHRSWLEANEPDGEIREEVHSLCEAMAAEARENSKRKASSATPMPESIGPYRIHRRLGIGGRGVVYLGALEAGRPVAIKVLMEHLAAPEDLQRFEREQRILAGLRHPAIAGFLDAGWDELGRPYLVMEWVDGDAVDRHCERNPTSQRQRIEWIIVALEAVQAAHQSLVVHLDLKPSNLLVDRQGQLKIVDFGTAKLLDDAGDSTRTRLMTPRYASPEQLRGEPLSTASDIYSVAATLCELLVGGTRESKRSSLAALAERAAGGTSVPRTASYPDLELVLRKAMDPDPQRRYATAIEFAEDLRACLECRPVRARRTTLPYQVSRFVARNRGGVSLVAVLMVALLGFAGYALNEQSQRLAETQRAVFIARFFISMLESSSTAHSGNPNLTVL
jgi:serine/threonine-protein kinase